MSPYRYRRQIAENPPPTSFWRKVKAWKRGFYTRLEVRAARQKLIEDLRSEYGLEARWADAHEEAKRFVRAGAPALDFFMYVFTLSQKCPLPPHLRVAPPRRYFPDTPDPDPAPE